MQIQTRLALAVILAMSLATACSSSGEKRAAEYKKSRALPALDVPPDLTEPDTSADTLKVPHGVAGAGAAQPSYLVSAQNARVERDGDMRWLLVEAPLDKLWEEVKGFWTGQGFELTTDEPALGIMATNWLENRADIDTGFFQRMVSKVLPGLYSAPTRDMFRIRMERGEAPGRTEIYVTHYGVEEISVDRGDEFFDTKWQPRAADIELANEMLLRLMVHLGVPEPKAQAKIVQAAEKAARARVERDSSGRPRLLLDDGFARAWRRTGIALDRIGLVVEDRDRSQGLYYVRHVDLVSAAGQGQKGLFGRLFGSDGEAAKGEAVRADREQSQIKLLGMGAQTQLTVLDPQGRPDGTAAAQVIVDRLLKELR